MTYYTPQMDQLSLTDLGNLIKLTLQHALKARVDGDNNTAITYLQITAKLYDLMATIHDSPELAENSRSLANRARTLVETIPIKPH